jgi:hypothetical protein
MTFWLERGESRFLDLITTSVHGLIEENKKKNLPNKYTLFTAGSKVHSLFKLVHPTILESQIKSFASVAQGRYIRELAYVLVSLNFCDDIFASNISKINIRTISDFDYNNYTEYIQSGKSAYLSNKTAEDFCKLDFASEKWANFLANKALSYGYFCRYLDVVNLLSEKSEKYLKNQTIFIAQLKNIIGPFDHRVSGSGPDFIQETFKSWAFFLDIVDIITNGELSNYNKSRKLDYLRKHSGYTSDGNQAYRILRNLKRAKIIIKKEPLEKIRVMGFIRLVNLETWRRNFNDALYSALRRVRILFYLDNRFDSVIDVSNLLDDTKLIEISKHFKKDFNIIEDLLYLECMGYRLETIEERNKFSSLTDYLFEKIISKKGPIFFDELKRVEIYSIFYETAKKFFKDINFNRLKIRPIRRFEREIFNKYCPQGEFIQWIQKN